MRSPKALAASLMLAVVTLLGTASPAAAHGNAPTPQCKNKKSCAAQDEYYRLAGSMRADQPLTIARAILTTYAPYARNESGRRGATYNNIQIVLEELQRNPSYSEKKCLRDETLHLARHLYQQKIDAQTMSRLFTAAEKAARANTRSGPTYVAAKMIKDYMEIGREAVKAANKQVKDQFAYESSHTLRACYGYRV